MNFSFAGLKTAVLVQIKKLVEQEGVPVEQFSPALMADIAASTQAAIVDVLVRKTMTALLQTGQTHGIRRLVVAGGVGANQRLRQQLNAVCALNGVRVHYPELALCTDNGAMIAMAAAMRLQSGQQKANTDYAFDVKPRWPLDSLVAQAV